MNAVTTTFEEKDFTPIFYPTFPYGDEDRICNPIQMNDRPHQDIDEKVFYYSLIKIEGEGRGYPTPLLFTEQAFEDFPYDEVISRRQEVLAWINREYRAQLEHLQDMEDRWFIENKKKYHF